MGSSQKHFKRLLTIIIIVCTSIIALVLFNSFLYESSDGGLFGNNFNMLTGMAMSGFTEITSELPGANPHEARINPAEATIVLDHNPVFDRNGDEVTGPFTIDVYAYPVVNDFPQGGEFDNYKIILRYFPNRLEFVSAENMVPGNWNVVSLSEQLGGVGYKDVTFEVENSVPDQGFGMTSTHLAEFTFKPKYPPLALPAQIAIYSVSINHPLIGRSTIFDDYYGSVINIKYLYYNDLDCDGYGDISNPILAGEDEIYDLAEACFVTDQVGDCDDDPSDDPDDCPTSIAACWGMEGSSGSGFSMVLYSSTKYCAICRNPDMPIDLESDDIDNNCDGLENNCPGNEICPECEICPLVGECGQEICGITPEDDDGDGNDDPTDPDCIGQQGGCAPGTVYVWTFTDNELGTFQAPVNNGCFPENTCVFGYESFPFGTVHYQNNDLICSGNGALTQWIRCDAEKQGLMFYNHICENGIWKDMMVNNFNGGSDDGDDDDSPITLEQYLLLTPGCGLDVDDDGFKCDYFENYDTCKLDCKKEDICDPNKIIWADDVDEEYGNSDYCVVDDKDCFEMGLACTGTNGDPDSLADKYEIYLESRIPDVIKNAPGYKKWFDEKFADSDGDGITDSHDVCPGTQGLIFEDLKVGVFGCPNADINNEVWDSSRPDGCYSSKDAITTVTYYTSSVNPNHNCMNIFGEYIKD
jgi:hypothetical protein